MLSFRQYLEEKPLNPAQRMARSRQMKRLMPKIQLKKKLALKKKANTEVLKKRAEKQAKNMLRKKFSGGKNYDDMSYAEKNAVDAKVEKKKAAIKKIAKKLLPKMKAAEAERVKNLGNNKD